MTKEMLNAAPDAIKIVRVEGKGVGVVASSCFEEHVFICEYRGELITKQEGVRREEIYEDNNYYLYFFIHKSRKLW